MEELVPGDRGKRSPQIRTCPFSGLRQVCKASILVQKSDAALDHVTAEGGGRGRSKQSYGHHGMDGLMTTTYSVLTEPLEPQVQNKHSSALGGAGPNMRSSQFVPPAT